MYAVSALLLVACLAAVAAPSSALECYACRMHKNISTVKLAPVILDQLKTFPLCDVMDKEGPSDKFKQTCPPSSRVCANIVDPEDETNRVRTCFPLGKDECKKSACYCTKDLCNSAGVLFGSLAMMAATLGLLILAAH